ncbi:MAG: hypothetical protein ACLUNV_03105 [Sutterella wadsworthensis]
MADIQQTTNKQHRMLKISILRFNSAGILRACRTCRPMSWKNLTR